MSCMYISGVIIVLRLIDLSFII